MENNTASNWVMSAADFARATPTTTRTIETGMTNSLTRAAEILRAEMAQAAESLADLF